MFKIEWLILAEAYSVDEKTKKFSISNITDIAWGEKFPVYIGHLFAIFRLNNTSKKFINKSIDIKVVLSSEGKTAVEVSLDPTPLLMEKGSIIPVDLSGVPFPVAGKYEVTIHIDGDPLAKTEITLKPLSDLSEP